MPDRGDRYKVGVALGAVSAVTWAFLLVGRGRFWQSGPVLGRAKPARRKVTAVVPARDEAEHIEASLGSLLAQQYSGELCVVLVDDGSTDGTGELARALAERNHRLTVIAGQSLPEGWTGKLWAAAQGLRHDWAQHTEYVLLTDADIVHRPQHVAALVEMAEADRLDLVSEMVRLRTETLAERAFIPAFVFFFQMLYPFAWVGKMQRPEAAAAGGTMLVTRAALERIGGIARIRGELIDDVALAREIKRGGHRIWLGHAEQASSLRRYPGFGDVWEMIARTAYVQLRYSPLLLAGTVGGLCFVYLLPVGLAMLKRGWTRRLGVMAWLMMAGAFQPVLRRYRRSPAWGLVLPAIAIFYMGATVASAIRFYGGRGGQWKSRVYRSAGGQLSSSAEIVNA